MGLSVLVIDKCKFPRKKLCGGLITHKTVKLLERVFGETVSSLKEKQIINYESNHYEVFYKNKIVDKKNIDIPFRFIDRYSYDNFLLGKAREAGADVIEGEKIISFDFSRDQLILSDGRILRAAFFIGADGINSVIRRGFPTNCFDRNVWLNNIATALEIFVSRSEVNRQINHPLIFFDFITYGYSWVFPNRDRLIIGSGGLTRKNRKQFIHSFHNFLSALDIDRRCADKIKSFTFPYGNFMLNPAFRNVMLVGDAAGFVDPLMGEGIFYAQRSAELASQAIHKSIRENKNMDAARQQTAQAYSRLLQKHVFPEFIYAKKIRNFAFNYFYKCPAMSLRMMMYMMGKRSEEVIHGMRTYRWFKKKE
jgi:flavin-dependent dehydrogenase